jgi:hypothetical protein
MVRLGMSFGCGGRERRSPWSTGDSVLGIWRDASPVTAHLHLDLVPEENVYDTVPFGLAIILQGLNFLHLETWCELVATYES